jgi:hypothetical protein
MHQAATTNPCNKVLIIVATAREIKNIRKASLWAENCPNFSFFLFGPGNLNYDKIFERGTTRLWVILIMGRENFPLR